MKIPTKLLSLCLALVFLLTTVMPSPAMADELEQSKQIYLLSVLSNGVSGISGEQESLQVLLTEQVNHALDDENIIHYIGKWHLVWGPVVDNTPSPGLFDKLEERDYARNSMFVAQKDKQNQYVVSIAGTNPSSLFDWIVEDSFVKTQKDWEYADVSLEGLEPKIAKGTSIGLDILLEMDSSGENLREFLGKEVEASDGETEIIFTGISLGGALSPVLALAALDTKDEWAGTNPFTISVEAIAGPTPGNEDFSTYYNRRLGDNTTRIWNSIDIVPHAWNEDDLSQIPGMYESEIEPSDDIESWVDCAKCLAEDGNYAQLFPLKEEDMVELDGVVRPQIPSICPGGDIPDQPTNDTDLFLAQAGYQHVQAYAELLDLVDPYCDLMAVLDSLSKASTTSIKLSTLEKLAATNQRKASADKTFCCPTDKISGDKQQCVAFREPVGTEMLITNETSNVYTKVQVEKSWSEGDQDIVEKTDPQMILPGKSLPVVFDQEKEVITVVMTETSNPSATDLSVQCLTP